MYLAYPVVPNQILCNLALQSSRSKSTTCLRKGRLIRFELPRKNGRGAAESFIQVKGLDSSTRDIKPEQSNNDNSGCTKKGSRLQKKGLRLQCAVFFSAIKTHCLLVEASCTVAVSQAWWVRFQQGAETLCSPSGPLCQFAWQWAIQCTDLGDFILLNSIFSSSCISSVTILCWQRFNSWHEHQTFWALGLREWGQRQGLTYIYSFVAGPNQGLGKIIEISYLLCYLIHWPICF